MGSLEQVSADGSWKIVVDAWSTNVILYSAMGVTTRVYERGATSWWDRLWGRPAGWVPVTADSVSASGRLSAPRFSPASMPIPGSPDNRRNDSWAQCQAWSFGVGITIKLDATFQPVGGAPGAPPSSVTADTVTGSGSATRKGEFLSVGTVTYPP